MGKKKHQRKGRTPDGPSAGSDRSDDGAAAPTPAEPSGADRTSAVAPRLPDADEAMTHQMDVMLRAYVERCLQEIWDQRDLVIDDDGDYPFRSDTSAAWVRVVTGELPGVRVTAQAAFDVPRTRAVLHELSQVNGRSRWAHLHLGDRGTVVAQREIRWTTLTVEELSHAMRSVMAVADDVGPLIAAVHGGWTPFDGPESDAPGRRAPSGTGGAA